MSEVDIKESLAFWKEKYGEEKVGRYGVTYRAIPLEQREELIIIFLRWMKMLGLKKEHFTTFVFKSNLIDACFGTAPPLDKEKRKNGQDALISQLTQILIAKKPFGKVPSGKTRKAKPKKVDTSKQKKAEKDKAEYEMYNNPLTPADLAGIPKTEVIWDDDLEKELGGK